MEDNFHCFHVCERLRLTDEQDQQYGHPVNVSYRQRAASFI